MIFLVTFACSGGRTEHVLREGACVEDVNGPDDLGCEATGAEEADMGRVGNCWMKNGELRCEVAR